MEKLFDDKDRTEIRYSRHLEKTYNFHDSTAKPEFVAIREILNDWFSRYSESDRHQMKGDFRSQFESAFFELFVHELFYQQGFSLTPHPSVPGSTKNPDFFAKKGDVEIYLEAKVATDKTNDERVLENKLAAIYDELHKLTSSSYLIEIEDIIFKSNKQAKLAKIRNVAQKWLNECHLQQRSICNDYDENDDECFSYEDDDIKILMRAHFGVITEDHPMGMYLGGSYTGGCEEALTNSIKDKGTKYGQLDKPYIICINMTGHRYPRTNEIYNTLFGLRRLHANNSYYQDSPFSFEMDGLFGSHKEPAFTQASAIFVTRVFSSNLHVADHWLIEHPNSTHKLDFSNIHLSYTNASVESQAGKSINQIINNINP